jgi:hypothetical protein
MGEEKKIEEEVVVDVEVTEEGVEVEVEEQAGDAEKKSKKFTSETLKDAFKQGENFVQALGDALQARGNVVMVRVNDKALEHLDMLVEADVTKSRSESAAFLISAGVKANADLFSRIGAITQQISELREQLRKEVNLIPETKKDEEAEGSDE